MSTSSGDGAARLASFGWSDSLAASFAALEDPALVPARVVEQHRDGCRVAAAEGDLRAEVSGRLLFNARGAQALPAVGDWVAVAPRDGVHGTIRSVLPRKSALVRKGAGMRSDVQVVAANVEVVLLATSLDGDFNPPRIARYAAFAWESGAQPIVVLTKADLVEDRDGAIAEALGAAPGVEAIAVSAVQGDGLAALRARLLPAQTAALVGSSGVGKSTLINALAGADLQTIGPVRARDGRGTHTTTYRRLLRTSWGALLVDTPGMRELGLVDADDGVAAAFDDVGQAARDCRFRDCAHKTEPGCGVRAAIDAGRLAAERLDQWRTLAREAAYQARRGRLLARIDERRHRKSIKRSGRLRDEPADVD